MYVFWTPGFVIAVDEAPAFEPAYLEHFELEHFEQRVVAETPDACEALVSGSGNGAEEDPQAAFHMAGVIPYLEYQDAGPEPARPSIPLPGRNRQPRLLSWRETGEEHALFALFESVPAPAFEDSTRAVLETTRASWAARAIA